MNSFRYILLILYIAACTESTKVEHQSIRNQILLNENRNHQSLELLRTVVHDSGDRTKDLEILSIVERIFELRIELNIDSLNLSYHQSLSFQHIETYLDSLSSRLSTDRGSKNVEEIQLAQELLRSSKKQHHQFYHLMLQISYLETVLMNEYSQFCIAGVKYD